MNTQAVKNELIALKENATLEEINRLDIEYLDPECFNTCIYGQMTGSCLNTRTKVLMKSTTKIEDFILLPRLKRDNEYYPPKSDIENSRFKVNSSHDSSLFYISPLENYIMEVKRDTNILNNIIRFLKNKISDLNFIK